MSKHLPILENNLRQRVIKCKGAKDISPLAVLQFGAAQTKIPSTLSHIILQLLHAPWLHCS